MVDAVLDGSPAAHANGSEAASKGVFPSGHLEGQPVPPVEPPAVNSSDLPIIDGEFRALAVREKVPEKPKTTGENISKIFSSIKQKLTKFADVAFPADDIRASFSGQVGGVFAKDKPLISIGKGSVTEAGSKASDEIADAKNKVIEAGHRANYSIVDAKERMVKRAKDAGDAIRGRMIRVKDAAREKIVKVSKDAASWGLTNVAAPIEDGLQAIYKIPASISELQAKTLDARAEKKELKAQLEMQKGIARAEALKLAIQRLEDDTVNRASGIENARNSTRTSAKEFKEKASLRRDSALVKFGNARAMAARLQAK